MEKLSKMLQICAEQANDFTCETRSDILNSKAVKKGNDRRGKMIDILSMLYYNRRNDSWHAKMKLTEFNLRPSIFNGECETNCHM